MKDRNKTLSNIQRVLTMLEKAVGRLSRQKFLLPSQRPPILDQIATAIRTMRGWIGEYRMFAGVKAFLRSGEPLPERTVEYHKRAVGNDQACFREKAG